MYRKRIVVMRLRPQPSQEERQRMYRKRIVVMRLHPRPSQEEKRQRCGYRFLTEEEKGQKVT